MNGTWSQLTLREEILAERKFGGLGVFAQNRQIKLPKKCKKEYEPPNQIPAKLKKDSSPMHYVVR